MGDGHSLSVKRSTDANGVSIVHLSSVTPDGRRANAVIRSNALTGAAAETGAAELRALFSRSESLGVLGAALPALGQEMKARRAAHKARAAVPADGGSGAEEIILTPETYDEGALACIFQVILWVASVLGFILACGIPEPVQPLVCAATILVTFAEGLAMADACKPTTAL